MPWRVRARVILFSEEAPVRVWTHQSRSGTKGFGLQLNCEQLDNPALGERGRGGSSYQISRDKLANFLFRFVCVVVMLGTIGYPLRVF